MKSIKRFLLKLSKLPRYSKQTILIFVDLLVLNISLSISFFLRLDNLSIEYVKNDFWLFIILPFLTIPFFVATGLYRAVLRHIGSKTMFAILKSITIPTFFVGFLMMMFRETSLPRSIFIIYWNVSIFSTLAIRYLAHWLIYSFPKKMGEVVPIAIYGAGDAGVMLAESIENSNKYLLQCFIDDDKKKIGNVIKSYKVHPPEDIQKLISKSKIKLILLAIPSIGRSYRKQILKKISAFPISVMELPSVENIIDGQVTIDDIKNVDVEEILGRESVSPIEELLSLNILNKNVMITGAGGSIGMELCRQIISLKPNKIILYEISEFNLYSIHAELINMNSNIDIVPILGSIQHKTKLKALFNTQNIDTVYHAAAYKHVPMIEHNPTAGVYNNILGTYYLVKEAIASKVKTFVFISTDKAVRPTSIMGATKRFSELILQALNEDDLKTTKLTMVRFGNVLDSAGSVLPLFRKQIRKGGPLTVTHSDIYRYFMSIPEAVQLVIQAGAMAEGGDVFLLDMGKPVNILDMAKKMIYLSGMVPLDDKHPNGDIEIKITGLRPGEKLFEELLIGETSIKTQHPQIMKANEEKLPLRAIEAAIEEFVITCKIQNNNKVKDLLLKYVKGYKIN